MNKKLSRKKVFFGDVQRRSWTPQHWYQIYPSTFHYRFKEQTQIKKFNFFLKKLIETIKAIIVLPEITVDSVRNN